MRDRMVTYVPWVVAALCLIYVGTKLMPRTETHDGMNLSAFAALPVSYGGRFQPWDSVARNQLMVLSNRTSIDHAGEELSAVRWLLEAKAKPQVARDLVVFRIDEPSVKDVLGLGRAARDQTRFSLAMIEPGLDALWQQAQAASQLDRPQRSLFQRKAIELAEHVETYMSLVNHIAAHSVPLVGSFETAESSGREDWLPLAEVMRQGPVVAGADPAVTGAYVRLLQAYAQGDAATFNAATAELDTLLSMHAPRSAGIAAFEARFNAVAPFTVSMFFYVLAGLVAMASWLVAPRALVRVGVAILIVTLVLHTFGLASRIYISGRPPVTNLYSSAVFIGWGAVILALLLEPILKHGLGVLTAATLGFSTLLIARALAADGDTMAVLQAVLDTNFWLATHVVVITLGYSAVYLAGLLGIVYILRGVFTKTLTPPESRKLGGMIYGVTCFGLLFSFVGTILGGIWADQSWGRFWGWDPKENGALMIVLWGALMLHARWGGMVKQRGLAVLAIGGNIITTWSWFGVNMLGAGLHSYGFIDSAVFWLMAFVTSQIVIIGIGLLPVSEWRSRVYQHVKPRSEERGASSEGVTPATA